jgi:hypothetical protein
MHIESISAQMKHHNMAMSHDMQTCRIECGCGCHQQLDSLPHLLSPHIVMQPQILADVPSVQISKDYTTHTFFYTSKVLLPPPNLS